MTDMIGCSDRMQEATLKSLIAKDSNIATTVAQYGIRIAYKTRDATADAITCDSGQSWFTLLTECLEIGTDGDIVLRVISEAKVNGSGLTNLPDCGTQEDFWLMIMQCFAVDTNGDICLVAWNIT